MVGHANFLHSPDRFFVESKTKQTSSLLQQPNPDGLSRLACPFCLCGPHACCYENASTTTTSTSMHRPLLPAAAQGAPRNNYYCFHTISRLRLKNRRCCPRDDYCKPRFSCHLGLLGPGLHERPLPDNAG